MVGEVLPACHLEFLIETILPTSPIILRLQLQFPELLIAVLNNTGHVLDRRRGSIFAVLFREAEAQGAWIVWVTVHVASVVVMGAVLADCVLVVEIVTVQVDDLILLLLTWLHLDLILPDAILTVVCFQPIPVSFLHLQVLRLFVHAASGLPRCEWLAFRDSEVGST